ncbi:Zn-dependent alcohol dehydrogenase [Wenxinia marina]|uniref:Zn-dependent alcohol dehydrogenase, class III n=1 Tax=Wenxinia marina DSM 24838 TaxID=1123501 RepID=A0A0D0NR48_9RHOB|nr:Zn-dependent alcohol dehydrogenase [Wenxinia marina]KIQ70685.1 Zn-dependent alcohol dehydrogenase, class III [Wenxinia marina DSM 24838]GGL51350.1 alcohol dehydrogenase [Wenxinia marina]
MTTIRAAVCREFGAPLTIEEVQIRAPVEGEVEVTLEAVAICHSDITYAKGDWGGTLPAVYGHEAAGRVTAIGPGVKGLTEGERVVVTLIRHCGQCAGCASGHPTRCEHPSHDAPPPLTSSDGGAVLAALNCGAFAEKVVVHSSQVVGVPDGVEAEQAALLACGVITGVGAVVNSIGLRPGQDAVVIGAGGVGLNAIQGARLAGARRIVAVDMSEAKLAAAKEFGATDGVLATDGAPWDAAKAAMGRGADAVFVTVGAARAYDEAPRYLAQGGRVVMVGMPAVGAVSHYEATDVAAASQSLVGSKMGDTVIRRDIPWLADLYLQGRLKLDELISRRWSLDEINEAIADTSGGGARRNVIVF